ncbi:MAG TPA: sulfatase [Planctomycetaceae bacterium]|nr:sulfatase [Rubinisphaera sp.]HCS50390.1 sulfatase [Planctomycetaceae bacterium]|tara:strand:- start:192 stop:1856 length:1665 start_codon:yes stop_codon:yes gene_type:complete
MFPAFKKRLRPDSRQVGSGQSFSHHLKYKIIVLLISASVPVISFLTSPHVLTAEPLQRPNIVLIMADDLGFADLGCYGSEIQTPYLDRLAAKGLRFSQFYNTAKCHSSRVSLLTGLYCDQAGSERLSRGATIAEALAPAGYSTAMVGKWHLSQQPTDFGFQKYWGHLSGATNFFTGDETFRLNGEVWEVPATLNGRPFYTTHAIGDYAIQFVDEMTKSEDPFLLYVAFNAPHYPLQAPEEAVKKYEGWYDKGWDQLRKERHARQIESGLLPEKWKLSPRPEHVPAWDSLSVEEQEWEANRMEVFAAMVDVLDQNVGRLVEHLKAEGEFENTLFMFCSDNGACPFERTRGRNMKPWNPKSYWTYDASWAHAGNTPFRLYKQNQHEGGISSPLIVHWPAGLKTKSGSITDQPGHLIDLMATFIDVGKADYPEQIGDRKIDSLQGKSLLPILQGQQREPHDELYFHFATDRALRQGDWKLVSAKLGRWELYNLKEDRTELNDLSKVHPERVEKMAAEWFRMAEEVDRLKGKQLTPVGNKIKSLDFRKDTSDQLKAMN